MYKSSLVLTIIHVHVHLVLGTVLCTGTRGHATQNLACEVSVPYRDSGYVSHYIRGFAALKGFGLRKDFHMRFLGQVVV